MLGKKKISLQTPLDYAAVGLVIMYFISIIVAVNIRLAIGEALKYFNYLVLFLFISQTVTNKSRIKFLLNILIFSGFIVALIGIGAAARTFKYNGAFVEGMINSTIQYHNTFGAYMLAVLLLSLSQMHLSGKKYVKTIYYLINFILFFGFVYSYSRGAWLLFPLTIIIYLLLINSKYRRELISNILGLITGVGVILKPFSNTISSETPAKSWLWIILGILVCIAITYFLNFALARLQKQKTNYKLIAGITIPIILAISLIFKNKLLSAIPPDLLQRLKSISLTTRTAMERFVFYKDALKIIKDHPVLGVGGGGWSSLYFMYQSFSYYTTQAHNYFIQLWIEVGTIGFVILLVLVVSYLYISYILFNKYKKNEFRTIITGAFTASFALLAHSVIDFDLTLAAISFVLWSLFGLINGLYKQNPEEKGIKLKIFPINNTLAIAVSICVLILTISLYTGFIYGQKGVKSFKEREFNEASIYFEKASKFDPFTASYKIDLAKILHFLGSQQKSQKLIKRSLQLAEKAVELDQYNSKLNAATASLFLKSGVIEKGLVYIEKSVEAQPLNPQNYENKAEAYFQVGLYYLKKGKTEKAEKYFKEVADIQKDVEELNRQKMKPIELTQKTKERIKKAIELYETLNKS